MQLPLELWGGVECTVNRVHDTFYDQLDRSGHRLRAVDDLELFASLGIRTLRTALHWEQFEKTGSWTQWDELMTTMQRLEIAPIVGLVHHGSGPLSTDLLDPMFAEKLAAFALQVARRYPHVLDYTPVNEPQTTSRFATLYGLWYPHHRSMASYVRAMFNQVKGIVLAMQAIRTVQPLARLIHTEDGGETFATPQLESYRVEREHRRWLGVDLLCGRVDESHPLFGFLHAHGLTRDEILWFGENPCPPSVVGLNYYVTSDRFLDHRLELYPPRSGGDTGKEPLVDIEAVRVRIDGMAGVNTILRQAWDRYGIPVAITEAHLGSDPLEQARWLYEVWSEAESARLSGVEVRAVTAWALLGSYNWCHLCTLDTDAYEAGVFDMTSGVPVSTPLAALARQLARGLEPANAVKQPGWWRSLDRLTIEPWRPDHQRPERLAGMPRAAPDLHVQPPAG